MSDRAWFAAALVLGVALTPVRGLCRTLAHAFYHPGCTH